MLRNLWKPFSSGEILTALTPLLALPFMLNTRSLSFVAPNEEPKWAVLTIFAIFASFAFAWSLWKSAPRISFAITLPGLLLTFFLLWLFIGIYVAPNRVEGAIRFAFWIFVVAVWVISLRAFLNINRWRQWLAWSSAISCTVFSMGYWWSYVIDYKKSGYNIHVLFSPIGHVNFTGDVLIIILPFLIWSLCTCTNATLRVLNFFSLFTALTVLLVASSRGALGGIIVGFTIMLFLASRHIEFDKKKIQHFIKANRTAFLWLATAIATSVVTYYSLPYHYRDLARLSGTLSTSTEVSASVKLSDEKKPPFAELWHALRPVLHTRTGMYASATAMSLDSPVLGQGTGNFAFVYPQYSNRFPDFRDPLSNDRTFTTNPHNIVLQLASQNGLPAMLVFVGLLFYLWLRLFKSLWRSWDGYIAMGVVAITAAIFDSMFNHVFFNPASMFTFALFTASWWAALEMKKPHQEVIRVNHCIPAKFFAIGAVAVAISLSVWPARWIISEWHVGYAMAHSRQLQVAEIYYQRAYERDPYNFRAIYGAGQIAYQKNDFAKTIMLMREMISIYPGSVQALNLLGAAYIRSGNFALAETTFTQALEILPGFEGAQQNLLIARRALMRQRFPQ